MTVDANDVLLELAQVFDRLRIAYVVGGSAASAVFGEPRATEDVDVVAALEPAHVAPLVAALEDRFYVDERSVRRAVETATSFNAIHLDSVVKVDVFVLAGDLLGAERMARRRSVVLRDPDGVTLLSRRAPPRRGSHRSGSSRRRVRCRSRSAGRDP